MLTAKTRTGLLAGNTTFTGTVSGGQDHLCPATTVSTNVIYAGGNSATFQLSSPDTATGNLGIILAIGSTCWHGLTQVEVKAQAGKSPLISVKEGWGTSKFACVKHGFGDDATYVITG